MSQPSRRLVLASLWPRLQVPARSGRLVLAAGAAFVATWSLGGFYQAFGPSVVAEYLGTMNPLIAAAVFASVMVLNPLGAPVWRCSWSRSSASWAPCMHGPSRRSSRRAWSSAWRKARHPRAEYAP